MAPWPKTRLILEQQTLKTRECDTYETVSLFSMCHVRVRYCLAFVCHVVGRSGASDKCKNFDSMNRYKNKANRVKFYDY
jgi:hypothetical protein